MAPDTLSAPVTCRRSGATPGRHSPSAAAATARARLWAEVLAEAGAAVAEVPLETFTPGR